MNGSASTPASIVPRCSAAGMAANGTSIARTCFTSTPFFASHVATPEKFIVPSALTPTVLPMRSRAVRSVESLVVYKAGCGFSTDRTSR